MKLAAVLACILTAIAVAVVWTRKPVVEVTEPLRSALQEHVNGTRWPSPDCAMCVAAKAVGVEPFDEPGGGFG